MRKSDKVLEPISLGSGWRSRNGEKTLPTAQAAPRKALATPANRSRRAAAWVAVALFAALGVAKTTRAQIPLWATPQAAEYVSGDALRRKLGEPQDFLREGLSLREALVRTSETTGAAIWLDRRIDPTVERPWKAEETPLEETIGDLVKPSRAAVGRCGDILYVGLPEVALRIEPTFERRRAEMNKIPSVQQSKLKAKRPFGWEPATQPREIFEQIGRKFSISIRGIEELPFDLWPGAKLPDSDAATQLSLVLAPFDATFVWEADGKTAVALPLSAEEVGVTAFTVKTAEEVSIEVWKKRFPNLQFERTDGVLYAQGPWAELTTALRSSQGDRPPRVETPSPDAEKRYSLQVENQPAGGVLKSLAEKWKLEVDVSPDLIDALKKRISLNVKDVEQTDLLDEVLHPVGLDYQLEGDKLIVREKL